MILVMCLYQNSENIYLTKKKNPKKHNKSRDINNIYVSDKSNKKPEYSVLNSKYKSEPWNIPNTTVKSEIVVSLCEAGHRFSTIVRDDANLYNFISCKN